MKYANQINVALVLIAVVVVAVALSRTYWSGEASHPDVSVTSVDSIPESERAPAADRIRTTPEAAVPGRISRPVPSGRPPAAQDSESSVAEQTVSDGEEAAEASGTQSDEGLRRQSGSPPAGPQGQSVTGQRRNADREPAAERSPERQSGDRPPSRQSQELDDEDDPQPPQALPGSDTNQRRQSPPPPPTKSSMPGNPP